MENKLVLIDGHSILNRAFFGIPDLTNSEGIHTNAIYGFLNILFKILDEEKPNYLTVAFDVHAPTFRHEIFEDYKGTRKPMANELKEQVPLIKEMLQAMDIHIVEKAGYEADDLIGTMARIGEEENLLVSVISGDRDLLQLATNKVKIRIPKTKRTGTEIEDYFAEDVVNKYQVTPKEFIDLKALMGDTADNIPGVPGIGEKTATTIIVEYKNIESAYEHASEITQKRARENLIAFYDQAKLSKTLATIDVHADFSFQLEDAKRKDFFTQQAYLLCKRFEFKHLLNRFEVSAPAQEAEQYFNTIKDLNEAEELWRNLGHARFAGVTLITEKGKLVGTSFCYGEKDTAYLPVEGFITENYMKEHLLTLVNEGVMFSSVELKPLIHFLNLENEEIALQNKSFDCSLAAYLLNPLSGEYPYENIAKDCLEKMVPSTVDLLGKLSFSKASAEKPDQFLLAVCFPSYIAYLAKDKLVEQLKNEELYTLYTTMELPLLYTICDMEKVGISADKQELAEYSSSLDSRIKELEKRIYLDAGEEFNINSPKQLGEILFGKLNMPNGKKTKTGYSTAADVLERLAPEYPLVNQILEYRQLTKLKSTYGEGLAVYIKEDGRIHTTLHQTIASTGRLSSTEPNLQNIPIRMEEGRRIRKIFKASPGCVFVDADYSQIELRVLAHMSGDERLIQAYREAKDIHKITASEVFHVPFDEVTSLQRRNAKAVNFGIVYGISSFGLSQDLSITRKEAAEYIEQYFATYPKIKCFLDQLVEDAKNLKLSTTLFGRKRPLPEIASSNFMQRSFGERIAMNAPIQGTAADIIKNAMNQVHTRLKKEGLASKLILQVHDELLIEAKIEEIEQVKCILREEMMGAADLAVPLEVDMQIADNWYDAK